MLGRIALCLPLCFFSGAAPAAPPQVLSASMDCANESATGRLVCVIEIEPPSGQRLSWADAMIVAAPPAARPLRSRVAARGRPPRRIELAFVLGSGEGGRIEVVVRAVLCPSDARRGRACANASRRVGFAIPAR